MFSGSGLLPQATREGDEEEEEEEEERPNHSIAPAPIRILK